MPRAKKTATAPKAKKTASKKASPKKVAEPVKEVAPAKTNTVVEGPCCTRGCTCQRVHFCTCSNPGGYL